MPHTEGDLSGGGGRLDCLIACFYDRGSSSTACRSSLGKDYIIMSLALFLSLPLTRGCVCHRCLRWLFLPCLAFLAAVDVYLSRSLRLALLALNLAFIPIQSGKRNASGVGRAGGSRFTYPYFSLVLFYRLVSSPKSAAPVSRLLYFLFLSTFF